MTWLLILFRMIGAWMRASGLVTGRVSEDRRVFLQAFAAMGGAALLKALPESDLSMPVYNWSDVRFIMQDQPGSFVNLYGGPEDVLTLKDIQEAVKHLERNNQPTPHTVYVHEKWLRMLAAASPEA